MAILAQILAFVQGMFGKSLLLYVTGWLLKLNPKFADEAIPAATAVVNILVAILAAMAEAAGGTHTAMFAAVDPTPAGSNLILDVLLPQIIADGAYNWPRKIFKWIFHHGGKVINR